MTIRFDPLTTPVIVVVSVLPHDDEVAVRYLKSCGYPPELVWGADDFAARHEAELKNTPRGLVMVLIDYDRQTPTMPLMLPMPGWFWRYQRQTITDWLGPDDLDDCLAQVLERVEELSQASSGVIMPRWRQKLPSNISQGGYGQAGPTDRPHFETRSYPRTGGDDSRLVTGYENFL